MPVAIRVAVPVAIHVAVVAAVAEPVPASHVVVPSLSVAMPVLVPPYMYYQTGAQSAQHVICNRVPRWPLSHLPSVDLVKLTPSSRAWPVWGPVGTYCMTTCRS